MISFTDCVFEELCLLLALLLLSFYIYCVRTGTSVDAFVNLEALFRRELTAEKRLPVGTDDTPSKRDSPDVDVSTEKRSCVDACPESACPGVEEDTSDRPVGEPAAAESKKCSGCPDVRPCPKRAPEPSSERSSLLSDTILEEVSEPRKSALADKTSKSKLPLSVSIQIKPPSQSSSLIDALPPTSVEGAGEKTVEAAGSPLEKTNSWRMAPPSENVLFLPKFAEPKSEQPAIQEEAQEVDGSEETEERPGEDAEIKAEETERREETSEETEGRKETSEETEGREETSEETEAKEEESEEPADVAPATEDTAVEGLKLETKPEEAKPGEPEKTKPGVCERIDVTTLDSTCPSGICVSLPPGLLPRLKDQPKDQTHAEAPPIVYIIIKHPDSCSGCFSGQAQQPPAESVPAEPVHELAEESTCICSISPCPKEGIAEPSAVSETLPKPAREETPTESIPAEKEPTPEPTSPGDTCVEPPSSDQAPTEEACPEANASLGWFTEEKTEGPPSEAAPNEEVPVEEAPVIAKPASLGDTSVEPPSCDEAPTRETSPEANASLGSFTEEKTEGPPSEAVPNEEVPVEEAPVIAPGDTSVEPPPSDEALTEEDSPEANTSLDWVTSTGVECREQPADEKTELSAVEEMPNEEDHAEEAPVIPETISAGDTSAKPPDEEKSGIEEAAVEEASAEELIAEPPAVEIPNEKPPDE